MLILCRIEEKIRLCSPIYYFMIYWTHIFSDNRFYGKLPVFPKLFGAARPKAEVLHLLLSLQPHCVCVTGGRELLEESEYHYSLLYVVQLKKYLQTCVNGEVPTTLRTSPAYLPCVDTCMKRADFKS